MPSSPETLFITGAASGIGQAVAQRFAGRGWRLALTDVNADGLAALADRLRAPDIWTRPLDVTDTEAVEQAMADVGAWSDGRLDVLFNSAGVMTVGPFEDVSWEAHRRHLDVNLWGVVATTRAAFPLLRDTPNARVISMASASGVYGTPELASYAATKAGVRSLTQALNLEWAHHDIHVCDVLPPYVDSPMTREAVRATSMDRLGIDLTPDDVADVVEQAVAENRVHWPVGKQFEWLYRASEVLPSSVVRLIMRYVSGF